MKNIPAVYDLYARSGGLQDGQLCNTQVDGVEYSNDWRGHHVVIIDVRTGQITFRSFDTWGSQEQVTYFPHLLQ